MKKNPIIRDAIDESLSGIHFNAQDMRSVMRAVRRGEERRAPARPKRRMRLDLAFSMALIVMIALPVSLFTLRARGAQTTAIVAAPGLTTPRPLTTASPTDALPEGTPLPGALSESEAIQIARACFEAQCDTTVFSFEEYTVDTAFMEDASGLPCYRVTMESVYDNNCLFVVLVSAEDGALLQYSTPRLATVPAYLRVDSPEVQSWFEKNGDHLFTWPQDVQAEFSRRYEGCMLRTAREGEITPEQASQLALDAAQNVFAQLGLSAQEPCAYPMLYSERASSDGAARYTVYCFAQPIGETLPTPCVLVTLSADSGAVEAVRTEEDAEAGLL